jgi:hypothetical protein
VIQFSAAARDLRPSEPPIQWVSAVQWAGPDLTALPKLRMTLSPMCIHVVYKELLPCITLLCMKMVDSARNWLKNVQH